LGLPDGTRVIIRIEPVLKSREKLKIISELSGAWSDDPSIGLIFEEIERERHSHFGRHLLPDTLIV
jgi:hypothetical protein